MYQNVNMNNEMIKIGDVVVYKPTPEEQEFMRNTHNCNVAEELPAFVVAVWSADCINIKVMYDGAVDDLWKTSVTEGYGSGQWHKHISDGSITWNTDSGSALVHNDGNTYTLGDDSITVTDFDRDNKLYSGASVSIGKTSSGLDSNGVPIL